MQPSYDSVFKPDLWLSSIILKEAYCLSIPESFSKNNFQELKKSELFTTKKNVFIFSKILPHNIDCIKFLEETHFHLIDTNINFIKPLLQPISSQQENFIIRQATSHDEHDTFEIAKSAFRLSRFHLDNMFTPILANTIKLEWVKNFFKGLRGQFLVVAQDKTKKIVGFTLLIENPSNSSLIIDLIAVHPHFQRKGIAREMLHYININFYQKYRNIEVGTQICNKSSIKFYESCGFKYKESKYVFHYHS